MRIQHIVPSTHLPWLLASDYNETMSLEARNHGGPDMATRCTHFKNWIANNEPIDLVFLGPNLSGVGKTVCSPESVFGWIGFM